MSPRPGPGWAGSADWTSCAEGLQDAQLDEGARVHIVHGDIARGEHVLVNIRKFTGIPFRSLAELGERDMLSGQVADLLAAAPRCLGVTVDGSTSNSTRRADRMEGDGDEQRARHFTDTEDDLEGVRLRLSQHLTDPTVRVIGCVATFAGRARADSG